MKSTPERAGPQRAAPLPARFSIRMDHRSDAASDAPIYTFWTTSERWPRDAGLRLDHLLPVRTARRFVIGFDKYSRADGPAISPRGFAARQTGARRSANAKFRSRARRRTRKRAHCW